MATLRPIAADAPELAAALKDAHLPTEDLADGGRTFFGLDEGGQPVGYAGYELYGEEALLRSVVVLPEQRGKGYGRAITDAVLAEAAKAGARRAFLLTTTADGFFPRFGFRRISRAEVPPDVRTSVEFHSACPESAWRRWSGCTRAPPRSPRRTSSCARARGP